MAELVASFIQKGMPDFANISLLRFKNSIHLDPVMWHITDQFIVVGPCQVAAA